tara:strand:+ start:3538 stop:4986 length:1449 start_codon:yes stop_codon:yes gene_type:complete
MSLKQAFLSGIKWNSVGIFSRALFQVLQISILTRFLPKEDFGLLAMALFVVQFSNIFLDMGLTSAILHKKNISKNEFSSIYWLNIFIALILYLLIYISAPTVSDFYNEVELSNIIPVLGLNVIFISFGRQHQTMFQKQLLFKKIALVEILSFLIGLLAAVYLATKGYGVYSLIYSTLIKSLLANITFLLLNNKTHSVHFHFKLSETKPFLKVGGFTMGSTLLDFFSRETDVLIIGKLLGPEKLGIYSLSKQLVLKLFATITPVIMNVLSPVLSEMQNETQRLKNSFLKSIRYISFINFPIYLVVIISAKEILGIVYGQEYTSAHYVLSCLAFFYAVTTLSNPIGSLQIATGRTDLGLKWTILRIIVSPVFIYIGALYNIESVALAFALLSLMFILPLWYIQLKPMLNISLKEYVSQFIMYLIVFGLSICLYPLLNKIEIVNYIFTGIIKTLIIMIFFTTAHVLKNKSDFYEIIREVKSLIKK